MLDMIKHRHNYAYIYDIYIVAFGILKICVLLKNIFLKYYKMFTSIFFKLLSSIIENSDCGSPFFLNFSISVEQSKLIVSHRYRIKRIL